MPRNDSWISANDSAARSFLSWFLLPLIVLVVVVVLVLGCLLDVVSEISIECFSPPIPSIVANCLGRNSITTTRTIVSRDYLSFKLQALLLGLGDFAKWEKAVNQGEDGTDLIEDHGMHDTKTG